MSTGLGIVNLQASCYLSAFVSCLLGGCLKWLNFLDSAPTPFIEALQMDIHAGVAKGADIIITPRHALAWYQRVAPSAFRDKRGRQQIMQDPNELLMFMLDEFDVKKNPKAQHIVSSYALSMSAELTCSGCHHNTNVAPQPCAALNMPIRSSWLESLEVALQNETLQDYRCVKCYVHAQVACKANEAIDDKMRSDKLCQTCLEDKVIKPVLIKTPSIEGLPTHVLIVNVVHTMPGQRMEGIEFTLLQQYDLTAFSIWTGAHHYACWRNGEEWLMTNDSQCTHGLTQDKIRQHYLPQAHQLFYMHKEV